MEEMRKYFDQFSTQDLRVKRQALRKDKKPYCYDLYSTEDNENLDIITRILINRILTNNK
tara:strand:- start:3056 stop:3235 length:180 start_codon:yes stop_codon:yes gene_type:complete